MHAWTVQRPFLPVPFHICRAVSLPQTHPPLPAPSPRGCSCQNRQLHYQPDECLPIMSHLSGILTLHHNRTSHLPLSNGWFITIKRTQGKEMFCSSSAVFPKLGTTSPVIELPVESNFLPDKHLN